MTTPRGLGYSKYGKMQQSRNQIMGQVAEFNIMTRYRGSTPQVTLSTKMGVSDISLFLGDVMISRHPHLRWEFFTRGEKNLSYQQNVITGFKVPNPRYNVNLDYLVSSYGHMIVLGLPVAQDEFVRLVEDVDE